MQLLNRILKKFIKGLDLESGIALNNLKNQWVNVVGQTIAAHTSPDTIRGKMLIITVDTPQWMHHLSFYKEDISGKLKPYNITKIRFKLGRLSEKVATGRQENNVTLTEEDLRYLKNTLKNIKDEELKEKFRRLITHGLTRGEKLR